MTESYILLEYRQLIYWKVLTCFPVVTKMKSIVIAVCFTLLALPVSAQNVNEGSGASLSTEKNDTTSLVDFFKERVSVSMEGQIQLVRPTLATPKHSISYKYPYVFPKNLHRKVYVPFHAAHFLDLRTQTRLTENLSLLVRLVLEGRSYCNAYLDMDDNNIIWSKLAVVYQSTPSFLSKADTIYFRAGDLERSRCGEGIVLDDFDGEGYTISYSFGRFKLRRTHIAFGIASDDDISYTNFAYKNLVSLNVFNNYNSDNSFYQVAPSFSFRIPILKDASSVLSSRTDVFAETGIMEDHIDAFRVDVKRCAFLFGASESVNAGRNTYMLEAQYRWYGRDFNRAGSDRVADQPYSQFSCDKKLNNWFNYLRAPGDIQGIDFYGTFKRYLSSLWFGQGNAEFLKTSGALNETYFLHEVGSGLDLGENVFVSFLVTNKIINRYLKQISYKHEGRWYTCSTLQLPTFLQTKEPLFTLRLTFQL